MTRIENFWRQDGTAGDKRKLPHVRAVHDGQWKWLDKMTLTELTECGWRQYRREWPTDKIVTEWADPVDEHGVMVIRPLKVTDPPAPEPEPYDVLRRREYPLVGDQLDAVVKEMNSRRMAGENLTSDMGTIVNKCLAVKKKYPKPVDEE